MKTLETSVARKGQKEERREWTNPTSLFQSQETGWNCVPLLCLL